MANVSKEQLEEPVQRNQSIYLDPTLLMPSEANEKARPTETPEERTARVARMAASIAANGQEYPVLVVEVNEGDDNIRYEYVDGGSRVEAVALLNEQDGGSRQVWCSLVDPNTDLYRKALIGNMHREQNSLLDLVAIVQEVFDRNGWRGRGGSKKVAEYLGLTESRVSEYQKIQNKASERLKELMRTGKVATVEVALQLLALPEDQQEAVIARAYELATDEVANKATAFDSDLEGSEGSGDQSNSGADQSEPTNKRQAAAKKARVKVKHVKQAAAEQGAESARVSKMTNKEVAEFFEGYGEEGVYSDKVIAFVKYFLKRLRGEGTNETAWRKFDEMVEAGELKAKNKPAAKTAKTEDAKTGKAPKKPAKK